MCMLFLFNCFKIFNSGSVLFLLLQNDLFTCIEMETNVSNEPNEVLVYVEKHVEKKCL